MKLIPGTTEIAYLIIMKLQPLKIFLYKGALLFIVPFAENCLQLF